MPRYLEVSQRIHFPGHEFPGYPNPISLLSREAKICPKHPSLYVRLRDIVLFDTRNDLRSIFDRYEFGFDAGELIYICFCHVISLW